MRAEGMELKKEERGVCESVYVYVGNEDGNVE